MRLSISGIGGILFIVNLEVNPNHSKRTTHMNKTELITSIAAAAAITKTDAEKALNGMTEAITKALSTGDNVTLIGFGTFSVSERAARTGRNPSTGKEIKIAAKKVAKFKPGKTLAESVK